MASGGRPPHLADAAAIEQWANRVEARTNFPRLVRRLISQTNDQVVLLDMRAAEGAGFAGYDGQVKAMNGSPFVPAGMSVWELGVGADPAAKAKEDYDKRTRDPLGVDKSTTTFVFVTARRWPGKAQWEQERRAEGEWADVRAFDADDIEVAFESAPATLFWFSESIGLPVEGVRMIEQWWHAYSRTSQPSLTPELVLAGRADESAALLRILDEEKGVTTIAAASPDDVRAFVAATLASTPEPARTDLLSRTLIVHDAAALTRIDATSDLLVLLPLDDELRREAHLVSSHHVILLAPQGAPAQITLPPIDQDAVLAILSDAGLDDATATKFARAAHRSVVAYMAEAAAGGVPIRNWSDAFTSKVVRRAWLAGGWQEARSGDVDTLSYLVGAPYEDAGVELEPLAQGEDPIFASVCGTWGLTSTEETWKFGLQHLTTHDLDALEAVVQTVLGAVDPALELPVDERWMAGFRGLVRIHSSALRRGLATTIAACGAVGEQIQLGAAGTPADWAASMVTQILRRANNDPSGDLWASLTDVLPLLAEAAPEAFLRAVQEGLNSQDEPLLSKMFVDADGDAFSVNSPHTGLLWALEGLAWSSEHAPLAIKVLARLAEIDPGGRLSNRPFESLVDIFRAWAPQTSLSLERRIAMLDTLRRDHPEVAWKLMLALLPEHRGIATPTHAPLLRGWKPETMSTTNGERWAFESAVANRLLDGAATDPQRWFDVVDHLDRWPPPDRPAVFDRLRELAGSSALDDDQREQIWNALDTLVRHHRSFPGADWSLPDGELDTIGDVAEAFRPSDPIRAHSWLFDSQLPDTGDARGTYDEQVARIEQMRSAAVAEVLAVRGVDGLLELAEAVEFATAVGISAANNASAELDNQALALLDSPETKHGGFAAGYALERARKGGSSWLDNALKEVDGRPLAQARLLQHVHDDLPSVWRRVAELGVEVEEAYWSEFATWGRGDFECVNDAATSLLRFHRPLAALDLMALYADKGNRRVSAELIVEGLQQLVCLRENHENGRRLSGYELESLLDYLRESEVDDERLGILEWQLLPALGFDARSPVLERRLARDPEFFIEILSLVYRPQGDAAEAIDVPEQVASNAYRLLDEWHVVPGSTERIGEVNAEQLNAWADDVRRRAGDADRLPVADAQLGKVLAHARGDEDGTWPTRPVRDLIERTASQDLEDGFRVEILNRRGVTSRGLTEGGEQERKLARHFDEQATLIGDGWPRVAGVLRSVAKAYEREARRNDARAERFRQGMND